MKKEIGKRIRLARERKGLKSGELAVLCGWEDTKSRVSNYENGISAPNYSDMVTLAKALDVNAAWLSFGSSDGDPDHATRDPQGGSGQREAVFMETSFDSWDGETPLERDEVAVPFFTEVEAAAGNGSVVHTENHGPQLRFSKSTLKKAGVEPESAVCIKVSGNSMDPVIPDGAVIGVDTSKIQIKDGDMYAIQQGDMLRVKVVYRTPTGYRLKSFNDVEYPIEMVEGGAANDLKVVGRIFWYSVLR